ncbi:DUF1206 domain-containing protein [Homoserinimonas sp. A520]
MPFGSRRRRAKAAAREASNSRPLRVLARGGLVASGLIHVMIGAIAVSVTYGLNQRADQSGALKAVAETPGGVVLLWIAAIALIGLAIWQWTGPMAWRPEGVAPNRIRDRFKAVGFLVVGLAAVVFAVGGRADTAKATRTLSSILLDIPGGVFILIALGIGVGAVGGAFVFRGVSRNFREDISPPDGAAGLAVITLGVVGHTTKGLALILVGALFVGSALFTDTSWASGLDGAVRFLASLPTGVWPLFLIAGGLIVHGLYLVTRARFMRR